MCSLKRKQLCDNIKCEICIKRTIFNKPNFQQLIDEFDKENNSDIDLLKLSYGSHIKIWWKCKNNHTFNVSLNSRTNGLSSCKICKYNDNTKCGNLKVLTNQKILNYDKSKINNIQNINGLKNEQYVYEILKHNENIEDIQLIGYIGGFADIIIKLKSCSLYKLLQVKTLTKNNERAYYLTYDNNYPSDLLIAMVDNEHKFYAVEFAGNINVTRLSLVYGINSIKSKYYDITTTNESIFVQTIIENIMYSTYINDITDVMTIQQKKEYGMRQRLKDKCELLNLKYKDNTLNYNTVDCFINDIPIQLKYASLNQQHRNTIQVTMRKSCGIINNKCVKQPYNITDEFNFVIIEIGDNHNTFCIIPKIILAEHKCISSNEIIGTGMCYVMPPILNNKHWTHNYWDKWEYFNA
jgi:hypothetical protein